NEAFRGMLPGTVQVKEHEGLMEVGRELILPLSFWRIARTSAGIRDERALLVVDRDHDAVLHDAFAGVMPEAEEIDCCFSEAAILGEIWMSIIKVLKGKLERRIDLLLCRLWWGCDVLNWGCTCSGRWCCWRGS